MPLSVSLSCAIAADGAATAAQTAARTSAHPGFTKYLLSPSSAEPSWKEQLVAISTTLYAFARMKRESFSPRHRNRSPAGKGLAICQRVVYLQKTEYVMGAPGGEPKMSLPLHRR